MTWHNLKQLWTDDPWFKRFCIVVILLLVVMAIAGIWAGK